MKRIIALAALLALSWNTFAADKKILLLAGSPSHGPGEHEFNAGCLLLKKCLDKIPGIKTEFAKNGWPSDPSAFDGVDAIFLYSDGGGGHPFNKPDRLATIGKLMDKGVGLGLAHYAVEVPKGPAGDALLKWTGGYFEINWSVNPTWNAEFKSLPKHPITTGVKPFAIKDEWYYHMRFREGMSGVLPILTAVAPKNTVSKQDSTHGGNPAVREAVEKGEPQHMMWSTERADGGRGFGFTGGHYHKNWGDPNFRKIILNAILWTAKADVPAGGVECAVTNEDLKQNLDDKGRRK